MGSTSGLEYFIGTNRLISYVSGYVTAATNLNPNTWYLGGTSRSGNAVDIYLDGQLDGVGVNGNAIGTGANFGIGNGPDYTFERLVGYLPEVIVYDSALATNPRNLIDQYQSAKWGLALDPVAGAGTEIAEATGATGYSVFSTRYLERLSQTADISLAATNNITLDLKTDTLALTGNRNLTLTAGNDILTASAGSITTSGTGAISFTAGRDINLTRCRHRYWK